MLLDLEKNNDEEGKHGDRGANRPILQTRTACPSLRPAMECLIRQEQIHAFSLLAQPPPIGRRRHVGKIQVLMKLSDKADG